MNNENKEILEFIESLKGLDDMSADDILEMTNYLSEGGEIDLPPDLLIESDKLTQKETQNENDITDIRILISKLRLPGKVKLAMFGNAACRGLLITNGNKLIQLAVLKNPKLQEQEIESFSKNPNLSSAVLRVISENKKWMKSYYLKYNITANPKTPPDVALKWFRFLNKSDLKKLSRSRDVSGVVVTQAKKKLQNMEEKKGGE